MNTITGAVIGCGVSCGFCTLVFIAVSLGLAHPNVIIEDGQTYREWWAMLFGSCWFAFVLFGMFLDCCFLVQRFVRKRN